MEGKDEVKEQSKKIETIGDTLRRLGMERVHSGKKEMRTRLQNDMVLY